MSSFRNSEATRCASDASGTSSTSSLRYAPATISQYEHHLTARKAILSQFTARATQKAREQALNEFDKVLKDLGRNSDDEDGLAYSDDEEVEDEGGQSGDETDEARDAADDLEIEQLEDEQAEITLTLEEARTGKIALEKVCN